MFPEIFKPEEWAHTMNQATCPVPKKGVVFFSMPAVVCIELIP